MNKISLLLFITLIVNEILATFLIYAGFYQSPEEALGYVAMAILVFFAIDLIIFSRFGKHKKHSGKKKEYFTTKNITRIAIFSALSLVLYMLLKFNLPFFPVWLDLQISDMPAMLAAFMMNPVAGAVVLLIRSLIKLPFTTTVGVGELADFLIGISYILPAYFIYKHKKNIKNAIIGMAVGSICGTVVAMLANWLLLIPMYVKMFDEGLNALVGMIRSLFPNITKETFYNYYIFLSVLPFNILRFLLTSFVTFFLYKPLKRFFDSLVKNS